MMTSSQVVETSVNVTSNSSSQDDTHLDDHNLPTYDMTPGFKPFTASKIPAITKFCVAYEILNRKLQNSFTLTNDHSVN